MADATWRDSLPDDLKAEPMFKDIPDVATLAKVARDTKSALGSAIRVPGPDAGAEAAKEFRAKLKKLAPELVEIPADPDKRKEVEADLWNVLGRPADAKEYAAEGFDADALEALRQEAVAEGLTKAQFAARAKRYTEALTKAGEAEKQAVLALKKELGDAFEERTAAAREAAKKMGIPEEAVAVMPARQLKAWVAVAKAIGGEAAHVGAQGNQGSGAMTPSEHSERAMEIRKRLLTDKMLGGDQRADLIRKMIEHEEKAAV